MSYGLWVNQDVAMAALLDDVMYQRNDDEPTSELHVGYHLVNDGGPHYAFRASVSLPDGRYFIVIGDDALEFLTHYKEALEKINK